MIDRLFIGLMLFLVIAGGAKAQEKVRVKRAEFSISEDGVPALRKIRRADRLMNKGVGYVPDALPLYLEASKYNGENAELNYKIGVCYLIAGPKKEAIGYLEKAKNLKANVAMDLHFLLGSAYQLSGDFTSAVVEFKSNLEILQQIKKRKLSFWDREVMRLCERRIEECHNARDLSSQNDSILLENPGGGVNSSFDEYYPRIVSDSHLYFTSRRGSDENRRRNPIDGKFYERIYGSDQNGASPEALSKKVNRGRNVAVCDMIGKDTMIVYRVKRHFGDLFLSRKGGKGWKSASRIPGINKRKYHESSASVTSDGKTLYFVSDRKKGFGKHDVYVSHRKSNGHWSAPVNLGPVVNTSYDEADVCVSADGSTLYFSSKGHNTMGGYDIFKSVRDAGGQWQKPVNLGMPINSPDNDIAFFISADEKTFYLASERDGGQGGFDIYSYTKPEPQPVEQDEEEIVREEIPEELPEIREIPAPEVAPQIIKSEPDADALAGTEFHFRVQVAAARKEMTVQELHGRYKGQDVIEHMFVEEWHRYTIGHFKTFEEAANLRDSCGVWDAFVVLFKGEYRLGIAKKP